MHQSKGIIVPLENFPIEKETNAPAPILILPFNAEAVPTFLFSTVAKESAVELGLINPKRNNILNINKQKKGKGRVIL
ncbi:hypothetical protein KRX57_08160 [Weeksellaceae bacterium TAE3-ERU29]|nr:hypothetical protein [Weeksellaceae bacterium TAE3-ERU29]